MRRHRTMALVPLVIAAAATLTGCATIRRSDARHTEQLLAAAGFAAHPIEEADESGRDATPPYRLVSRAKDGTMEYAYADPDTCRCVYVGGSKEYSEYQRLLLQRQLQQQLIWALEDNECRSWRCWPSRDLWGGW